jgi:hypothetical protein
MGSNRQYIDEVIPHIGTLLCERMGEVLGFGDVIVLATKGLQKSDIVSQLGPDQQLIDLVRVEAQAATHAAKAAV